LGGSLVAVTGDHFRIDPGFGSCNVFAESVKRGCGASRAFIQAQETGARFVHRLGNLMLLPQGLNSKLSAKKSIDKISEYRATGLYAASQVANTIEANVGNLLR
jgi:hypothetical protein